MFHSDYHFPKVSSSALISCLSQTTLMLGLYISIFVILANILFICAIYSCIKLFPVALQTVTKKIVHSRANSTLVGVFTILLLFIASFANM
ncbi:hypothetical protein INR49_017810, partial [Caranx melampygus]